MNWELLRRVLWPERGPLFVVVGGVVSLVSDFASFLANIASPQLLIWPVTIAAGAFAWVCISRVLDARKDKAPPPESEAAPAQAAAADADPVIAAANCRVCDIFRVVLFAGFGVVLLLMAGQGATATERIGAQLGLIQQDVAAIREDATAIREVTATGEINRNPRSAEDFFENAWLYQMTRRDTANAWDSIQELYRRHTPNKIDAAILYMDVGRAHLGRDALVRQLADAGRARCDGAALVVAARNTENEAEATALYEAARGCDPDLPFAYWDVGRLQTQSPVGAPAIAKLRAAIAGYERFLEIAQRKPVASYFFLPQYQPDWEEQARTLLNFNSTSLQTVERIEAMSRR